MDDETFAASLASGPRALLASFAGDWAGVTRTWFEPDKLGDESETEGAVRSILGGRFVVHSYRGSLAGEVLEGEAILGFEVERERYVSAWVEGLHTGTTVMHSVGDPGVRDPFSVLGSYDVADGAPWGWRTTYAKPSPDELVVSHHNVPPGEEEYLGIETRYRRRN